MGEPVGSESVSVAVLPALSVLEMVKVDPYFTAKVKEFEEKIAAGEEKLADLQKQADEKKAKIAEEVANTKKIAAEATAKALVDAKTAVGAGKAEVVQAKQEAEK